MLVMCMSAGLFSACVNGSIDYGYVRAYIKKEYNEKFNAKGFTLEDFGLDNIKDFSYFYFYTDEEIEEHGDRGSVDNKFILLELKNKGKKYAEEAIEHLEKLEFVTRANFRYKGASPGKELL